MRADIAETIRWWRSTGVPASAVWEAVTGRPRQRCGWDVVAALLAARTRPSVLVAHGYSLGPDGAPEALAA